MRKPILALLLVLAGCGSDRPEDSGSSVSLSFLAFPVRATSFAPSWVSHEPGARPAEYYLLQAVDSTEGCGSSRQEERRVTVGMNRRDAKALAPGDRCPLSTRDPHCEAIVQLEHLRQDGQDTVWSSGTGAVEIVSLGADRLVLDVDAQVYQSGRACEHAITSDPSECACTGATSASGSCREGPTENLKVRLEGTLCRSACSCDVAGADPCTCQ